MLCKWYAMVCDDMRWYDECITNTQCHPGLPQNAWQVFGSDSDFDTSQIDETKTLSAPYQVLKQI